MDKPILTQLRLAKENYNHRLFVHPPIFVYTTALLKQYLLISIPGIPIIFQLITICCIPILCNSIVKITKMRDRDRIHRHDWFSLALLSTIVFSFCPILGFCSQKLWIDNALLATTTTAVTFHTYIINYNRNEDRLSKTYFNCFLSGLFYGGITLNCKITGLAIIPFLIVWIAISRWKCLFDLRSSSRFTRSSYKFLWDAIVHSSIFVFGAFLAHLPWLFLYKVNTCNFLKYFLI